MMRLLGIDYGVKRVGIALTDETGTMAFPHSVIENSPELAEEIAALVRENGVTGIVIGSSHNLKGEDNPVQASIEAFTRELEEKSGIPVQTEPEQYTTQEALRTQGRTPLTDASAATIILNSYLNRQKNNSA